MATGAGYSAKYRGTDQVTLCFFGDGAANEGTFHESINMAAAWDLPVVYVIENNLYGITVDSRRVTKEHDLAKRAIGYGIPGYTIDGNDVETVYKTMQKPSSTPGRVRGPRLWSARPIATTATTAAIPVPTVRRRRWRPGKPGIL